MREILEIKQKSKHSVEINMEDFGVNIFLGLITSIIGISIIGFIFFETNVLFERIIDHINTIGLGLQILPSVFVLLTQKTNWLRNYWISIFWLTILFELLIFAVVMIITKPN